MVFMKLQWLIFCLVCRFYYDVFVYVHWLYFCAVVQRLLFSAFSAVARG